MVVANLDASLLDNATRSPLDPGGRPELSGPLIVPTGRERDTRDLKFDK